VNNLKLKTVVTAIFDRFIGLLAFVAGILAIFLMLGVSTEVFARYLLNMPITGVIEVSEIILLWIVFLGAAWVLKIEGHVSMDLIVSRLSTRGQAILNVITSLIGAAIAGTLFWYGTRVTWALFQSGTPEQGILAAPIALVVLIIPVGSLPLCIQFLRRAYGYWRGTQVIKTEEEKYI